MYTFRIGHCRPRGLKINCLVLIMLVVWGTNGPVREERTENNSLPRTLMNEVSGINSRTQRDSVHSKLISGTWNEEFDC